MVLLSNTQNILYWQDEVTERSVAALRADNIPHLVPHLHQEPGEPYPCVIVLPGGGYLRHADHECGPVAGWLNGLGINAFVLNYSVAPARHPKPYHDVRRAIQWVRKNAAQLNIDPKRIGVLGFSAGGHLAGTAAAWWENEALAIGDELDSISARPDLAVLCCPVVTGARGACNEGSLENLMGTSSDEARECFSLEKQISAQMPPTFIWHTADDVAVPISNTFLMAEALASSGVEFELHIFPEGIHGLGLCGVKKFRHKQVRQWIGLCEQWFRRQGF
ncbi:alpha/beta hydrolase [Pontiellaceae bacterium B12219]|nr:alpha/beta hydrolase [Pontiellaceae bacterium B12219]